MTETKHQEKNNKNKTEKLNKDMEKQTDHRVSPFDF